MENLESSLPSGTLFAGRYKIEKHLGSGGMGEVYLASDSILENEKIALKVLHAHLSSDSRHSKRFLREVQLTRKLSHPNVVKTFDVGADAGRLYFTMEFVDGQTLKDKTGDTPLAAFAAIPIFRKIALGLQAIHELGIVHRDLKPANVILQNSGEVKITDFGVARSAISELTGANEVVGSVSYVPPEVWLGKETTGAADIYSLGILAYQALTGIVPFDGDTPAEVMCKHLEADPVPLIQISNHIPVWLNDLVLSMLEKDPAARPQSAALVVKTLERGASKLEVRPHILDEEELEESVLDTVVFSQLETMVYDADVAFAPAELKPEDLTHIRSNLSLPNLTTKKKSTLRKISERMCLVFLAAAIVAGLQLEVIDMLLSSWIMDVRLSHRLLFSMLVWISIFNLSYFFLLPIFAVISVFKGIKRSLRVWSKAAFILTITLALSQGFSSERGSALAASMREGIAGGGLRVVETFFRGAQSQLLRNCRRLKICTKE